jgi:hypothetical protein
MHVRNSKSASLGLAASGAGVSQDLDCCLSLRREEDASWEVGAYPRDLALMTSPRFSAMN